MKTILISIVAALGLSSDGLAQQRHALHGLFCNTEEQIDETLGYMRRDLPLRLAVEMTNEREVACVNADRIRYVIADPAIIGRSRLNGDALVKYEAMLVGVIVGVKLRPIEPPVRIFLLSGDHLPGAVVMRGA
jgi:hypothetical protein